jgi:MYXO-CTERM domain-containing protein
MFRSLAIVSLSVLASSNALAGIWTVGSDNHDFFSVADAMGDGRVQSGDTIRILSGSYVGFDTGDKALTIEPGNSPGIVNFSGNVRVRANSMVNFEIGGLNSGLLSGPTEFDQFIVNGNVAYEGTLGVVFYGGFTPSLGNSWALIQASGNINFSGLQSLPALADGLNWNVQVVSGSSEFGASGSSLIVSVVPAPGAVALIGLAGLATTRRRRD